jgi:release factor glutamine methyltransferase
VVSNPPYVEAHEVAALPEDVARHEPREALVPDGGDVAAHYAGLRRQCARVLAPGGWWLTEVGAGQAGARAGELRAAGWEAVAVRPDLAGHGRVVQARRPR